jgi:hypothetical protein
MHYTLCDLFCDLTQNAFEAGASAITVKLSETDRDIALSIEDNGKGMTPDELKKATDPFWTDGVKHPGRKIGLGIPFLIQTAESTGGKWDIRSEKGVGTTVTCRFDLSNIDTPPIGDVAGFFRQVLAFDGDYEMVIRRERSANRVAYNVRRSELLEAMGLSAQGAFTDAGSLALLGRYLESMEE